MKKIITLILTLALALTIPLSLTSCGEKMGTGSCEYLSTRDISQREVYYVEICVKNYGKMVVLLDRTTAPQTVDNFIGLVEDGFYDGLTFHRVLENFMIQGGDPKANGLGGSSKKIYGEFLYNGWYNDISHKRGVISMARNGYDYNSASSQFFICNADASYSLDGQYAAFGYVVKGMSVVDKITEKTAQFGYDNDGAIENKKNQAVIKYIKVLDNYNG